MLQEWLNEGNVYFLKRKTIKCEFELPKNTYKFSLSLFHQCVYVFVPTSIITKNYSKVFVIVDFYYWSVVHVHVNDWMERALMFT